MMTVTVEQLKEKGNCLFREKKYEDALKIYEDATRLDSTNAACWSNQAACFDKLGDYAEMKRAADKAVSADPTFVKGYYRLAKAQKELGELTEAIETLDLGLARLEDGDIKNEFAFAKKEIEELAAISVSPDDTTTNTWTAREVVRL